MVWFGMGRSDLVWFGLVWCMDIVYMKFHAKFRALGLKTAELWPIYGNLVWFGMVWFGLVLNGTIHG